MNTLTIASTTSRGNVVELSGNYRRTYRDFLALHVALTLDDLSSARQAFVRLQNDSPHIADAMSRDPFPAKNPRLRALKKLGRCLMTGDLRGAKEAFLRFN